jgi:hypothetical protein
MWTPGDRVDPIFKANAAYGQEGCNECGLDRVSYRAKGVRLCVQFNQVGGKEWLLSQRPPAIVQLLGQRSVVRRNVVAV